MKSYKANKSLEERILEADQVKKKYPDRVCVICERAANAGRVPDLDKNKFLVPEMLTVGQFMFIVRKRLRLDPGQAIFFFVGGQFLPTASVDMVTLYKDYKDEDGLLYILYATENTFGGRI